jgi:hypothetical protein
MIIAVLWYVVRQKCTYGLEFPAPEHSITYTKIYGVASKKTARIKLVFGGNKAKSNIYIYIYIHIYIYSKVKQDTWAMINIYKIPAIKPQEMRARGKNHG